METQMLVVISILLFIVQLLLCFKSNNLTLKLMPVILLLIVTGIFAVLMHTTSGYDAPVYAVFTLISGILLIPCAIVWIIWVIYHSIRRNNT